MKRNYMANIIMKYQEQFVNFPGKQGLAIKSKQGIELFDIISCQLPGGSNLFSFWQGRGGRSPKGAVVVHLQIIEIISLFFFFFNDLHLQIIQSISTIVHWVKFSVCQQSTVTECILNLLDPSTAWGEGGGGKCYLFLLILCLQVYYWQCLGFRSLKKACWFLF